MGYVDYGKIMLFDCICNIMVVVGEVGGIIQYMGVQWVLIDYGDVVFFDILGYEVFSVM